MVLSQSFPPMTGGKPRPKTGFNFSVQKRPVLESGGSSLERSLTWRVRLGLVKETEIILVVEFLPDLLTIGRSQAGGVAFLMCYSPQLYHNHLLQLCRLVHFPNF